MFAVKKYAKEKLIFVTFQDCDTRIYFGISYLKLCIMDFLLDSDLINPIKAVWSESMYRLGGGAFGGRPMPPSKKKSLENWLRVEMQVHSPIFQGQLIEKNRSVTFIVLVLGRVVKMPK